MTSRNGRRGPEWALDDGAVEHPVLRLFTEAVRDCGIPHEYPLELIEGMRMDLAATRYRTFQNCGCSAIAWQASWD